MKTAQELGMKKACLTGVTGQVGSYLAELLLQQGFEVWGLKRSASNFNTERIDHIYDNPNLHLVYGDLADYSSILTFVNDVKPDLFFNCGALSVSARSLIPVLKSNKVDHVSLESLWDTFLKKGERSIRTEKIDDIDVEVIDLPDNNQIRALGYWNGMGNWFKITQINRHWYKGKMARLSQKFGEIEVTPNHSVYDVYHNICQPEENPWLLNVRKINYNPTLNHGSVKNVPITKEGNWQFLDKKPHSKIARAVSGKNLAAFAKFLGAYISEGHITFNKANNSYYVGISNQNKPWLEEIAECLLSFYHGNFCYIKHKKENHKDVWELQVRSKILYNWLKKNCGQYSKNKKIPSWIFQSEKVVQKSLFDALIFGDGSIVSRTNFDSWRYFTSSYKLACQLGLLFTNLGYDYTVRRDDQEGYDPVYQFREAIVYQPFQGNSGKKIEWYDYDGYVYDITVERVNNFALGIGNIVVHNSHVRVSFDIPEYAMDITGTGVVRCLEALRRCSPDTRFLQCSTSELYGSSPPPQDESTTFHPRSPYACAKLAGYWSTVNYREAYDMFAVNSITFNTESPRRAENFVTRKVTRAATRIKLGLQDKLVLGNLSSERDWSHAYDTARGMYTIISADSPSDYVLATGEKRSVKEFVELVFSKLDLNYKEYVDFDERYLRPTEVDALCGDASKAKESLGWEPLISFDELVDEMIEHDLELARQEKLLNDNSK